MRAGTDRHYWQKLGFRTTLLDLRSKPVLFQVNKYSRAPNEFWWDWKDLFMKKMVEIVSDSKIVYIRHFMFSLGIFCTIWACDRQTIDPDARGFVAEEVATIKVTPTKVSLAVGQTQQLSAMLGDAAGNMLPRRKATPSLEVGSTKQSVAVIGDSKGRTGRIVTWSSSQPTQVSVDADGLVTALAVGTATITATCEKRSAKVKVIVIEPPAAQLAVVPVRATLSVGETLQLTATMQDNNGNIPMGPITWNSVQPSRATVNESGLLKATAAGITTITATGGDQTGAAVVTITPSSTIHGLDFPGNAGVNKTMRFEFTSPLAAYPATYIWRVYPRQQQSYYTAFFWGNNGAFFPSNTYYGFHPYPDWNTAHQHFWEIASTPGGDFVGLNHVVYDHWYIQVAVCYISGSTTVQEFYWDWPDVAKVVRHTGKPYDDPPMPGLVVGDAPWNHGNEVWDGVLRGFQFYDVAMTPSEIAQEIVSPGSVRKPWYLNLNPTPCDISDQSGNRHHPTWVGAERPSKWTGMLHGGTIIRTVISPR